MTVETIRFALTYEQEDGIHRVLLHEPDAPTIDIEAPGLRIYVPPNVMPTDVLEGETRYAAFAKAFDWIAAWVSRHKTDGALVEIRHAGLRDDE